ncbi:MULTISPECIES: alpha-galactosidase [unclassified Enterococcus]|uniref:alpha-galactosidase n=1 Tax=unclassified Enterococcus TaxID=2608891 RepID=UPI001A9BF554|nr:alpha-galactosidase [Enterococcus sp. DIV1271a]MBO1299175.1 alpha-galactosidase [Enterococcus sp. DIV1271a]
MIEQLNDRLFHMSNPHTSFILHVMQNGQIEQIYYGKPLRGLTDEEIDYLVAEQNKSAGTVKFFEDDSNFTLTDHPQAYPVYGTSDFKEGAIELSSNQAPYYTDFRFVEATTKKGKARNLDCPTTYGDKEESETLSLRLIDQERQLELILHYTLFCDSTAIVQSQTLTNQSKTDLQIHRMLSGVLNLSTKAYDFTHFSGAWLKERHEKKRPLEQGIVSIGSLKGASSHQHNPFIRLDHQQSTLDHGEVYGLNLVYSGNFIAQAEVDEWDKTRVMIGIHPSQFRWTLAPEDSFTTPEAVLMYSDAGTNGLAQHFTHFIENHLIDRKWRDTPRPIVFNNWEATYFDFTEEKLLSLATIGKHLGMECFVLDDGWFGKRNNDRSSLGDWTVDKQKFPTGLASFANKLKNMGLQFGMWFEPEMISPDSQLLKQHPDWVVKHPYSRISVGRGQYVLDFSNPDVVAGIYEQMAAIIEETNVTYIKWDMNRNITEAYSAYLEKQASQQQEFFHRYVQGVYALYGKLLTAYPDLLIEGCAGGGGRYDLGILFYSPQIWPSDNSDGVERLSILSGTLAGYPLSSFSNHVSASPNHQVLRETSLAFRQDVAMFGPLGYELDLLALTDEEKQQISERIAFYKAHRHLLTHGKFVQILPNRPYDNEICWGVFSHDRSEAIIGFYQKMARANPAAKAYLPFPDYLKKDRYYQINGQETVCGNLLMNVGLKKPRLFTGVNHTTYQLAGDCQSFIYHIVERKDTK